MAPIDQLLDTTHRPLKLHDLSPAPDDLLADVVTGLSRPRKELPCKLLYDERGSALFDAICDLREYYPTRTELSILRRHGGEMAQTLGGDCLLVEYGSGSGIKTRILLDRLAGRDPAPAGYVPIDISRAHLLRSARALAVAYPGLEVLPVCADYTAADLSLPVAAKTPARTVVFFPGSTIGNFHPPTARQFLRGLRRSFGAGTGLLIGVDLKKDPAVLHAAYNDADGVTAAFNLNVLARINRELAADFDLSRFAHYAFYNVRLGRVEMHLVSLAPQAAHVGGHAFRFEAGESIFTESSYKYTPDEFARLAADAGFRLEHVWTDERRLFSVQYLVAL